jgi:hypothetical protein
MVDFVAINKDKLPKDTISYGYITKREILQGGKPIIRVFELVEAIYSHKKGKIKSFELIEVPNSMDLEASALIHHYSQDNIRTVMLNRLELKN